MKIINYFWIHYKAQQTGKKLSIHTSWWQVKKNEMDNWIEQKITKLSIDSKSLFDESLLCYKIKAFRASLLFSYLGFLTIIKEIIISSKKPELIEQTRWDKIIFDLNIEDKWEKRVYDELINSGSPIFNISESVRQQIKYWKDRRNDCAHFKQNEINISHVEIFWSFLKSNLSKITIEGGKLNLLKKFLNHFDETKTPPDSDYTHLIKEIEHAIEINESESFFKELDSLIGTSYWFLNQKVSEIYYNLIIHIDNEQIKRSLVKFIKSKNNFDFELIKDNSQLIFEFNYSKQEIRNIWKSRLFSTSGRLKYYIYAILLRNNLIPKSELVEAMEHFYLNFNQDGFANIPEDDEIKRNLANKELLDSVYIQLFSNSALSKSKFGLLNSKADLITLLLEFKKLDLTIVEEICKMYENGINPWWLTKGINYLFENNTIIKNEFEEICTSNNLTYPNLLI